VNLDIFKPDPLARAKTRQIFGFDENAEVMITTRWLDALYGVGDFIRALPRVFEQRPNAAALIVGSGSQREQLESLTHSLGIADRVKFAGPVSNNDLPQYLNAADLYVSPSHSDGTSLSLLEAMGCGLPVAVTDIDSIREWVVDGDNGRLVPIGDSGKMAEAIIELFSDPAMLRRAADNNLAQAQTRANWDRNFEILESMYERLMTLSR
jgi:glycosyltransferase involved in cell wall biosynthesis